MERNPDSPAVETATAASPEADLNHPPQGEQALVQAGSPALPAEAEPEADADDLSRYRWVPVLRKPRKDGWTPQRQVEFIAALADTGCVAQAARGAAMSERSCYRLRRESPPFAAAWDAAIAHSVRRLVDIAFDRAIHGSDEPVFDKEGYRVGRRMRQNDRLLMFLLRAYMPERFGRGGRADAAPGEAPPAAAEPVAEALLRLEPEAPPEPHRLMPPEELDVALQCADILDGRLPHWHRGRGELEVSEYQPDPEFERLIEAAKAGGEGLPPERHEESDGDEDDAFLG